MGRFYLVMSLSGNFQSLIKKRQLNLILVFFFSEFQHNKITKLRLSTSQLTSNVLNSFIPSFKNLTYLDLRSNSLTSFTNTIPQITTIDIGWALWQYGLLSFQTGGTKLERFLPKNQHTQRKLLNNDNWVNGEVLKIGHHVSKESDLKNDAIKICQ